MKPWPLVFVLVAVAGWAQPDLSIEGVRRAWYVVPTGGDLGIAWDSWKLSVGAGLEDLPFGRWVGSGDPLPESDPYTKPLLPNAEAALKYTWSLAWADVWAGVQAAGYGVWNGGNAGAFPDRTGNVYGALQAGAVRDKREWNAHGLESGYTAAVSADWSPTVASVRRTDYHKVAFQSSLFVPLWDVPGDAQLFSGLLAFRADAQFIDGTQVPILRLEPTEVRGYNNTYDAKFLTAGSAELRMRLPSWWKDRDVVPVGFGFIDVGSYAGYADVSSGSREHGTLAGAGIGGGLELFGKVTPTLTLAFPLIGVKKTLWWDLGFQLAY